MFTNKKNELGGDSQIIKIHWHVNEVKLGGRIKKEEKVSSRTERPMKRMKIRN